MITDIGFVEKCESWLLQSRFFPSKVGGKPAWLDLKNIPGEKDVQCEYCQDPCTFLCQIYAPFEESENSFHRSIYIFICKKPQCCRLNESGNLKVLRSQLGRDNEFYPSEPPIEDINWRTDISAEKWTKTCYICGILARNHCSKCKTTNYCCRAHQLYDWQHGHKESCDTKENTNRNQEFLFPEYELVIESEDSRNEESGANNSEKEEEEIEKYNLLKERGEAGTFQNEDVQHELLSVANQMEDETFSVFHSTSIKYPDQVLRYSRGGKILYISSHNTIVEIPRCPECNGERQFEFQIMPQLLNYLKLENPLKCIDWGILAIFTCIKSCVPKNGYSLEYLWKQDIIEENTDSLSEQRYRVNKSNI